MFTKITLPNRTHKKIIHTYTLRESKKESTTHTFHQVKSCIDLIKTPPNQSKQMKPHNHVRIYKTKYIEPDTNRISTADTQVPHKLKVSSRINLSVHMY